MTEPSTLKVRNWVQILQLWVIEKYIMLCVPSFHAQDNMKVTSHIYQTQQKWETVNQCIHLDECLPNKLLNDSGLLNQV